MLLYVVALLEISERGSAECAYVHLKQHGQSTSGPAESRHEVLNQESRGEALPGWHANAPSLGACDQHRKLV